MSRNNLNCFILIYRTVLINDIRMKFFEICMTLVILSSETTCFLIVGES